MSLYNGLSSLKGGISFANAGGLEPYVTTPAEFSAMMRREYDKYGKVVKAAGIKLE